MRLKVLLAIFVAAFVAATATDSRAQFHANSVVPLFCTNDTIPAGTELYVRMRWAVSSPGAAQQFVSHQNLTWSIYDDSTSPPTLVASSPTPNPTYGDTTFWSGVGSMTGTITDAKGKTKTTKFYFVDYLAPTGIVLDDGESVRIAYHLSANVATDDGFGNVIPAFSTIASGSSCVVTGVAP